LQFMLIFGILYKKEFHISYLKMRVVMATIIAVCSWVIAGVVWGDWRNWAKYHTTVFYFMFCDIMYYLVTVDHRLWSLEPTWPLHSELVVIWGELIVFTSTVLIYFDLVDLTVGQHVHVHRMDPAACRHFQI
jgi:hypothetical protein